MRPGTVVCFLRVKSTSQTERRYAYGYTKFACSCLRRLAWVNLLFVFHSAFVRNEQCAMRHQVTAPRKEEHPLRVEPPSGTSRLFVFIMIPLEQRRFLRALASCGCVVLRLYCGRWAASTFCLCRQSTHHWYARLFLPVLSVFICFIFHCFLPGAIIEPFVGNACRPGSVISPGHSHCDLLCGACSAVIEPSERR